jgi:hypothetical protein
VLTSLPLDLFEVLLKYLYFLCGVIKLILLCFNEFFLCCHSVFLYPFVSISRFHSYIKVTECLEYYTHSFFISFIYLFLLCLLSIYEIHEVSLTGNVSGRVK